MLVGAVAFYAGDQTGAAGVDSKVSSELSQASHGSGLLGGAPDYSSYVASLAAGCNPQVPALENMSAQLKAYNAQLQRYASLPYNSTVGAEIQKISSESQALQQRIHLAMTQISQCWSLVSSMLQSINQTMQSINSTVRRR